MVKCKYCDKEYECEKRGTVKATEKCQGFLPNTDYLDILSEFSC